MSAFRCNLVIPGFPKSGTSSFHEYLSQHPAICMSDPKEPQFFSRSDNWARGPVAHDAIFEASSGDEKFFGESSTTYCIWPEAAKRIASSLDAPKVILLLRHPAERAISHYRWMYRLGLETRSFREALRVDGETFHPDRSAEGSYRGYLAFSRYADHVPEWEALFPRDDVLLVFTDDLAESPGATLSRVHEFLGLPAQPLAERERINRTRDQRRIQARPWAKSLRKAVPDASAQSLKRVPGLHALWSRASRPQAPEPPPITESDRAWLDRGLQRHIRFYHERR